MSEQYWIGGFFIDLSRNQISQNQQSQTLAPKALAVLTYLAENQGRVVSYDELFDKVWPDTVVSPNTLQRSVAQLRKALGDDGKGQVYIQTHAKQGYSLECDVHWQSKLEAITTEETESYKEPTEQIAHTNETSSEDSDNNPVVDDKISQKPWLSKPTLVSFVGVMIIFAIIALNYSPSTPQFSLPVEQIRALTATDNKEFGAIYSPDGEYIVFSRYSEKLCIESNIWAKNIKTQKETQLTPRMGVYGRHSFSPDGKTLTFIESESCIKPIEQKTCYNLMTLDFDAALRSPQSPQSLMACKNSKIKRPTWLNNKNILVMQEAVNRWQLVNYSISDNQSRVIYSRTDGNFIDYDYSVRDNLIALTSIHADGLNYIEKLTPEGQLISSKVIEYPTEITHGRLIFPNFTPLSNLLVFSTGRQLFTLSFDGNIRKIHLPLDEPMGSPTFHPDGNRMLVIKGRWDSDIAALPMIILTQSAEPIEVTESDYRIRARSNLAEEEATFQPNGEFIAFKSNRSGEDQIWLAEGENLRQLTHFPMDTYITGVDWSANGQSILVNANNALTQVRLDATTKAFPLEHHITELFQWHSDENTALVQARVNGVLTLAEVNLNSLEFKVLTDKRVKKAHKTADGLLVYTDQMDRFWQPGAIEAQLIEPLIKQGSERGFIVNDNVIYGINEQLQLWSYDLNQEIFTRLATLPEKIDSISDVNQQELLLNLRVSAKKEVAELILAD